MSTTTPLDSRPPEEQDNPVGKDYDNKFNSGSGDTANFLKDRENLDNSDSKDNQPAGDPSNPAAAEPVSGPENSFYKKTTTPRPNIGTRLLDPKNRGKFLIF